MQQLWSWCSKRSGKKTRRNWGEGKEEKREKNKERRRTKKRLEERAKKVELKAKQKAQKEEEKARWASAGRKRAGDKERNSRPAKCPRTYTHCSSSDFNQSEYCVCFVTLWRWSVSKRRGMCVRTMAAQGLYRRLFCWWRGKGTTMPYTSESIL